MSNRIGIIAEDRSDIAVINSILLKHLDNSSFRINKFIGKGCGKIQSKCCKWAKTLYAMGCKHLFVIHDLDDKDEKELKSKLQFLIKDSKFVQSLIVIPVIEIEAWLLADSIAIKKAFNLTKAPRQISNTELIKDPKKYLRNIVWKLGRKRYLNTVHNEKIANKCRLISLRKCKSFIPLELYIKDKLKN